MVLTLNRNNCQQLKKSNSYVITTLMCELLQDKLKVYLAPVLYGNRYTSYGRHFTQVEKLEGVFNSDIIISIISSDFYTLDIFSLL